jgi:hypothetical protein
MYGAVVES